MGFWMPDMTAVEEETKKQQAREEEARDKKAPEKKSLFDDVINLAKLDAGTYRFMLLPTFRKPEEAKYKLLPFVAVEDYAMVPPNKARVRHIRKSHPEAIAVGVRDHLAETLDRLFQEGVLKSWDDLGKYPNRVCYTDTAAYVGVFEVDGEEVIPVPKIVQMKNNNNKSPFAKFEEKARKACNKKKNIFSFEDGWVLEITVKVQESRNGKGVEREFDFEFDEVGGDTLFITQNGNKVLLQDVADWATYLKNQHNLDTIFVNSALKDEKLAKNETIAHEFYNYMVAKMGKTPTTSSAPKPKVGKKAKALDEVFAEAPPLEDDLPF